jgi:hypothetical protein
MKLTVLALVFPVVVSCFGETGTPEPRSGDSSASTAEHAASAAPEVPKFKLQPGKIEIGGLLGGNLYSATPQPNPSLGGEFILGLPHGFGVFAGGILEPHFQSPCPGC